MFIFYICSMYRINLNGDIGESLPINYLDITEQLNNANGQDLEIIINTLGGEVDEAFKIYDALEDYKRTNKATITTITDENCASSGVILLLAGNRRIVNKNSKPFVHNAWVSVYGANSKDLKDIAEDLEQCDLMIAELYAKKTALSVEEALELMNNDYEFTPEESYNLGFATELSKVYNHKPQSARLVIQNKLNSNKQMSKEKTFFEMARNFFLGEQQEETETAIQNKIELTVSDAELDFYELDSDATPTLGDKANFDGKPAEGDFKMKNGKEYEFENGTLKEIKEEIEEVIEEVVEENKVNEQIQELNTQIENLQLLVSDKERIILNLQEELESSKVQIEKFNKLESQFIELNKKEQRSTEVEEKTSIDINKIKNFSKNKNK